MNQLRWGFRCRTCGRIHVIPYSALRTNSRRYEVHLKCPYNFDYIGTAKYKGSSFFRVLADNEKYKVIHNVRVKRASSQE